MTTNHFCDIQHTNKFGYNLGDMIYDTWDRRVWGKAEHHGNIGNVGGGIVARTPWWYQCWYIRLWPLMSRVYIYFSNSSLTFNMKSLRTVTSTFILNIVIIIMTPYVVHPCCYRSILQRYEASTFRPPEIWSQHFQATSDMKLPLSGHQWYEATTFRLSVIWSHHFQATSDMKQPLSGHQWYETTTFRPSAIWSHHFQATSDMKPPLSGHQQYEATTFRPQAIWSHHFQATSDMKPPLSGHQWYEATT